MSNYWQVLSSSFSSFFGGDFDSSEPQVLQGGNPSRSPSSANFFLIPTELIELIFDNCDSNALRASRLVCRYWRTSTTHIFFSRIALYPTTSSAFVEFLHSKAGEPVRGSVRVLSLTTGSDFVRSSINDTTVESLSVLLQPSSLKLTIYNNAGSKRVDGLLWWARQRKDLRAFQRSFMTVKNLELTIYSDNFIEVAEIISSFPILETLTLSGAWFPVDQEDENDGEEASMEKIKRELSEKRIFLPHTVHTIRPPSVLHSSFTFLHWLRSHEHPPCISTLALSGISALHWQLASAYLQERGDMLQCLAMSGLMSNRKYITHSYSLHRLTAKDPL